jgi:hypothetical protein
MIQECRLCFQEVQAAKQLPFNTIMIEAYSMCPSCRQRVSRETENAYSYRVKWLAFVRRVKQRHGLDYRPGYGFRRVQL